MIHAMSSSVALTSWNRVIQNLKARPPWGLQLLHCQTASLSSSCDVAIVGGGIVGLAAAQELIKRKPGLKITLVEKENELAMHQTGHNSGVVHAGIYYKPGSLMAKLCVEGMAATYKYCDKYNLPYKKVGKLVVATNDLEEERLLALWERANQNGVPDLELVDRQGIKDREPACEGVRAIWSPHTGIVDWGLVARHYGKVFQEAGGEVKLGFGVAGFRQADENVSLRSKDGRSVQCGYVLACAGLQADRVAALTGCQSEPKIVPFRGEYLLLTKERAAQIRGNIYPVPDPRLPFLGVHFTPRMDGSVWLGPNAVLALAREGYSWGSVSPKDLKEILTYPGFYRLAYKYLGYGLDQMLGSLLIRRAVRDLRKFVPDLAVSEVTRGPAGVRAQAMSQEGDLVGDFIFHSGEDEKQGSRVLHCRNAPSPAATSSLSIAKVIVDKMEEKFSL